MEELRGAVRGQIEANFEQQVEGEFRGRVLDAVSQNAEVEVPDVMVEEKADEMVGSFERSVRQQGIEPEQYYQIAGVNPQEMKERVKPDATDTVKKELVLDAVAVAEGLEADEDAVMHEIGHLAEESGRKPEEIVETMRRNGTYTLLEEEMARQQALSFWRRTPSPSRCPKKRKPKRRSKRSRKKSEMLPKKPKVGRTPPVLGSPGRSPVRRRLARR